MNSQQQILSDGVVTLRPFRLDDAGAVAAACRDPDIPRFTHVPDNYTESDAREFIAGTMRPDREERSFAIVATDDERFLGAVGFRVPHPGTGEVGYWLAPGARGRGAATRAVRLLCEWAFGELGLVRVQLLTHPENAPSQRLAERLGFRREGVLRAWADMKEGRADLVMYSLLPGELTPAT
jgi:RimJ/RimL family protein N-acetyltransferase